jgi:hypothetical protein
VDPGPWISAREIVAVEFVETRIVRLEIKCFDPLDPSGRQSDLSMIVMLYECL